MVRFYKDHTPSKGETVVVKITDCSKIIMCELLEYNNLQGMICRAEVSRNTVKKYKSLSNGKIIPVVVSEVAKNELGTCIDLNYVVFDKEQESHYLGRYERIQKIINIFTQIAGSQILLDDCSFEEYYKNDDVIKLLKQMVKDSIRNLSKDDLINVFYENVQLLHDMVDSWNIKNYIHDFKNKLLRYFPKPKLRLILNLSIYTIKSFGIKSIKKICLDITNDILKLDDNANVNITLIATPEYRFEINSERMDETNILEYYNVVMNYCDRPEDRDIKCKKLSQTVETTNGVKVKTDIFSRIIDVQTVVVNGDVVDSEVIDI
jgi:translation initiation factor 2 alpha subunit (eIF-2alpha)